MQNAIPYQRNALGRFWDKVVLYLTSRVFAVIIAMTLGKRGQRMSHNNGIAARGTFTFDVDPRVPPHPFFENGKQYPCRIRHAQATFFDDAMPTIRSCSLKLSDKHIESPFDVQCNTGQVALFWSAASFIRIATLRNEYHGIEYEDFYKEQPAGKRGAIDTIRNVPNSYALQTYYSKTPMQFNSSDGVRRYCRYRIVPFHPLTEEEQKNLGIIKGTDSWRVLEPQNQRVAAGETRGRNYLKQEYVDRLREKGTLKYRLQIQWMDHKEDQDPIIFNCCVAWDEDKYPYYDLGYFEITEALDWRESVLTSFSVTNAPKGLDRIPARSIYDYNSVNYMRAHMGAAFKMRHFYYWLKGMLKEPPDNDNRNSSEPI